MDQVISPASATGAIGADTQGSRSASPSGWWADWRFDAILVSAISICALLLRLRQLGARSLWVDEGASVAIARLPWGDFLRILWRYEGNMALYYLMLRGWMQLGSSETILRWFSVLAAVLSVPALYLLGRRMYGRSVGLMAALFLAVNAFHIRYSQEARSYALLVLAVIICFYLFVRSVESPSLSNWALWGVASALAVYIHFFSVLVTVAQLASIVFLGMRRIPWRNLGAGLGLYAVVILPVPVFIWNNWHNHQLDWVPAPNIDSVYAFAEILAGEGGRILVCAYLACLLSALLVFVRQWQRHDDSLDRFRLGSLFLWLLLPIAITLGATILKPVFVPRYLAVSLPALALLAAWGVGALHTRWRIIAALGLAALALHGARNPYARDSGPAENWRSAVQYLTSSAASNDVFLLNNGIGRPVFEYYRSRGAKNSTLQILFPSHGDAMTIRDFQGVPDASFVERQLNGQKRFWVVDWYATPSVDRLLQNGFQRAQIRQFPGVTVSLYLNTVAAAPAKGLTPSPGQSPAEAGRREPRNEAVKLIPNNGVLPAGVAR